MTTLEEVFLKVAQGEVLDAVASNQELEDVEFKQDDQPSQSPARAAVQLEPAGCGLHELFRHVGAQLTKRAAQAHRDPRSFIFVFLIPISAGSCHCLASAVLIDICVFLIAVLFGLIFVTVLGSQLDQPLLKLTFDNALQRSGSLTVPTVGELSSESAAAFERALPSVELQSLDSKPQASMQLPCTNTSSYSRPWFASFVLDLVPAKASERYSSLYNPLVGSTLNCLYDRYCCISSGPDDDRRQQKKEEFEESEDLDECLVSDSSMCSDIGNDCCAPRDSKDEQAACRAGFVPQWTGQGCASGQAEEFRCCQPPDEGVCISPEMAIIESCNEDSEDGAALRGVLALDEHLLDVTSIPGNKLVHTGALVFRAEGLDKYTLLHNTAAQHALPTWVSAVDNARLTAVDSTQSIQVSNHPWPMTAKQKVRFELAAGLLVALLITMGLCFVPAAFTSYVVQERERKTMHQQHVSGMSVLAYYLGNYLWDLLNFLIAMVMIIALFFVFADYAPAYTHHLMETSLVFILYGLSSTAFAYCFSFLFSSYSTATVP